MDWKICAIDDLRRYKHVKVGILNSKDRLSVVNGIINDLRKQSDKKGRSLRDTKLLDAVMEAKLLRRNISAAESTMRIVERGLDSLSDDERALLEKFFMQSHPKSASSISKELGYSLRSLYRARDQALEKFTLAMYGVEIL